MRLPEQKSGDLENKATLNKSNVNNSRPYLLNIHFYDGFILLNHNIFITIV